MNEEDPEIEKDNNLGSNNLPMKRSCSGYRKYHKQHLAIPVMICMCMYRCCSLSALFIFHSFACSSSSLFSFFKFTSAAFVYI